MRTASLVLLSALALGACGRNRPEPDPSPTPGATARVNMRDASGRDLGNLSAVQTANGVLLTGLLNYLPAGTHAIHIHTVGRCEPTFDAAGGHFNPMNRQHGYRDTRGPHAGDLPNINVGADGMVRVELFTTTVNLGTSGSGLFDEDGSTLMIHALADDYATDPSGSSGARIACGVIMR